MRSFSFTQYSYYCDLFCSGTALRFRDCHCHGWMRYIGNTESMGWCMSLLLLSIGLQWFCYFIMIYFKLTNGAMLKWWILKQCNGEIKIRIGHFVSHKYRICSFVLFLNTKFSKQTKQFIIFKFWSLTTSTATKFMLSNQTTTERRGFIRGQQIVMR